MEKVSEFDYKGATVALIVLDNGDVQATVTVDGKERVARWQGDLTSTAEYIDDVIAQESAARTAYEAGRARALELAIVVQAVPRDRPEKQLQPSVVLPAQEAEGEVLGGN